MQLATKEPQYQFCVDVQQKEGTSQLGLMTNQCWFDDPKRMVFFLARYKFVAKMARGKQSALEVGCGDGFGTRIVCQEVPQVTAIDFDPVFVEDVKRRMAGKWRFDCFVHDILKAPVPGSYDVIYSLDVFEHILPADEDAYMANIVGSLNPHGLCIIGTPSLQSQAYASKLSKLGHVNCKDQEDLKQFMCKYYHNVFCFSMNDEVVHTGFGPMAHYNFAMGVGPRK